MRNLKKFVRGIVACAIMSAGILVSSCNKDMKQQNGNAGTTDIVLDIPMLKAETKAPVDQTQEDAIHKLRVIILSQGANSINTELEFTPDNPMPDSILIKNVPVGKVQMYVIANEEALGKDYRNLADLQKDVVDAAGNTRKVLVTDADRMHFPKRGSEFNNENSNPGTTKGLPMSWMNKDLTINPPQFDDNNEVIPQTIEVELERCVAKLNIIMQSTLSEDLVIKSMNFGTFFGDRLYLFREPGLNLDVPDDAGYVAKTYGDENNPLNITIPANGEETLVCYIYPSFAWKDPNTTSPYTIGFVSDKATYEPKYFVNNHHVLNSIARNKQVNITAKLSKPANIDITFEVVPWENQIVDVPSFN